jgi:hypothetical protein
MSSRVYAPRFFAKNALISIAPKPSTPFELTDFPGSIFSPGIATKEDRFPFQCQHEYQLLAPLKWLPRAGLNDKRWFGSDIPDLLQIVVVFKCVNRVARVGCFKHATL